MPHTFEPRIQICQEHSWHSTDGDFTQSGITRRTTIMAAFKSTAHFVIIRDGEEQVNTSLKKVARTPKELPKSTPASSGLIPVAETSEDVARETSKPTISELGAHEMSFVAELATVSHDQLDHPMPDAAPLLSDVDDDDVIMVDAPELEVELHVPELDSVQVLITVEDADTVMEDAPPLSPARE